MAEASRRRLLDRVVADNVMICGSHFPWPGVGRMMKDGAGYVLRLGGSGEQTGRAKKG
jgi:hypothetical protein